MANATQTDIAPGAEAPKPVVGSYQYDLANNLPVGTSSSGDYRAPAPTAPVSSGAPTEPIISSDLKPVDPLNLPNPTNTSAGAASSAIGEMEGINKNILSDLDTQTKALESKVANRTSVIDRNIQKLEGRGVAQSAAEIAAGIPELRSTAQALTQEYNTKTLAYNAQYKAISQDQTLSADQRARQLSAVTNEHALDQTNLAIRTNIAQGNYAAAQANVDKKIDIEFGGLKDIINYQTALLSNDESKLTDKEKSKLAIKLDNNKRKLDEVTYQAHRIQDTKTDLLKTAGAQGAPQDVLAAIQSAKTPDEAITAAGRYGGDILERETKRAQLDQVNANIRKLNAETKKTESETFPINVPNVNNPDAAKYKPALDIILGSKDITKENKASIIRAVNNGEDPFIVIKNRARTLMGTDEKQTTENYETVRSQSVALQNLMKQYYDAGGKTGIFTGNFEKVINNLGEVSDPGLVNIGVQISSALQAYRKAITGTAYSNQEGKDIATIFPGINKSAGLNDAIIKARLNFIDTTIDANYRNVLGKTYDDIKKINPQTSVASNPITQDTVSKVNQAVAAGHKPDDILTVLKNDATISGQIQKAIDAGWNSLQIVDYLSKYKPQI